MIDERHKILASPPIPNFGDFKICVKYFKAEKPEPPRQKQHNQTLKACHLCCCVNCGCGCVHCCGSQVEDDGCQVASDPSLFACELRTWSHHPPLANAGSSRKTSGAGAVLCPW